MEAIFNGSTLADLFEKGLYPSSSTVTPMLLQDLGQNPHHWPEDAHGQWGKLIQMLQANRPVIVGHNVVYDLAFLHTMFVGPLPATASSFQDQIRGLCPRLIDTKVMICQTVDADVIDASLEETYADLMNQAYPTVEGIIGWMYRSGKQSFQSRSGAAHHAGYDSKWLRFGILILPLMDIEAS